MALKHMFNEDSVSDLAQALQQVYPKFPQQQFFELVFTPQWPDLELKQRMRHITLALGRTLPQDYRQALEILQKAVLLLPQQSFEKMVFPDFVEVFGIDDYEASIPALEYFTQHMSAEFAVRPFIIKYPQQMMAQMQAWSKHASPAVRRLSSEGSRPRLPWGMAIPALKKDPAPILPILEQLKLDPSESVRRSVSNNLNDIAKDHPEVTLQVLRGWQSLNREEITAITRHALRTLLKDGNPQALEMLGYPPPKVKVQNLQLTPASIPMGGEVRLSFEVVSITEIPQEIMIDYVLHLVRANNKTGTKVFKLTTRTLQPGETLNVQKSVSFAPITTRRYYPGEHAVEPQINGQIYGKATFTLEEE